MRTVGHTGRQGDTQTDRRHTAIQGIHRQRWAHICTQWDTQSDRGHTTDSKRHTDIHDNTQTQTHMEHTEHTGSPIRQGDTQTDRRTHRQTWDTQQTERHTDRQTDRQTGGTQADRGHTGRQ
jgi:hypothetical protein